MLMNVQQIMVDVIPMQFVQIQLVALIVHVKQDILEMVLIVLVLIFNFMIIFPFEIQMSAYFQ